MGLSSVLEYLIEIACRRARQRGFWYYVAKRPMFGRPVKAVPSRTYALCSCSRLRCEWTRECRRCPHRAACVARS